jgi:propanol-preferring alcohol dehydrogenase
MQAVRFAGVGRKAQIEDVPRPKAGPGQVVIEIGGAGVCHSDLHVMEDDLGFEPGFTLGHENAGPWGCGRCHACQVSMENYCENWEALGGFGGGLGFDGGMRERAEEAEEEGVRLSRG